MDSGFRLFDAQHLTVLAITVFLPIVFVLFTRRFSGGKFEKMVLWTLAGILFLNRVWALQVALDLGVREWRNLLPLHLCDVANFMVIIACLTKHAELVRVTYFFSLAGTMQAILTPDIRVGFPEPRFLTFFISHCGIVVASIYLTLGCRILPTWGAVVRAFVWLQVYAIIAGLANWLLGTNFGYLARKPENPSMLDYFGPWPWYILVIEVIALLKFILLMSPFAIAEFLKRRKNASLLTPN